MTALKHLINNRALELGFSHCGFSKADFLEEEAPRLEKWLSGNMHGKMSYMERYFDLRLDPRKLVPGARTVISLLFNYFPSQEQNPDAPKIARYAYGTDYHFVIKDKLKELFDFISEKTGPVEGRVFIDSAPVLDRAWAKKSGLGWIGKNSNLINRHVGSYFFIAEIILDLEIEPDAPMQDYCGTCTRCIDACPTEAIIKPNVVDGSKCISYFTIELKEEIPTSEKGKWNDWAFGCDICQEVCPWNRFAKPTSEPAFKASEEMMSMNADQWYEMTEEIFGRIFKKSAVKRAGYKGMQRNLQFLRKKLS